MDMRLSLSYGALDGGRLLPPPWERSPFRGGGGSSTLAVVTRTGALPIVAALAILAGGLLRAG
jgi:hypothetical protein